MKCVKQSAGKLRSSMVIVSTTLGWGGGSCAIRFPTSSSSVAGNYGSKGFCTNFPIYYPLSCKISFAAS
jgi:hypothetical protein